MLTTGQMIEKIKHGEIAFNEEDMVYVKKKKNGSMYYCDKNGITKPNMGYEGEIILNWFFLGGKWRILPKYVPFEEAMKALNEGETVCFHYGDGTIIKFNEADSLHYVTSSFDACATWGRLTLGKWTIEGDTDE